jgi:hypothetical protein
VKLIFYQSFFIRASGIKLSLFLNHKSSFELYIGYMKFILIVILCLTALYTQGQTANCDSIVWKTNRKLTWSDFKGQPDDADAATARTRSNFVREWLVRNNVLYTKMICFFSPCLSWSKSKQTNRLLRHEQGHFDITEVYRRLYYKRIANATYTPATLPELMKTIYQDITQECAEVQEAYDVETHHSLLAPQQAQWEQRIAAMLKSLKRYDKEELRVKLFNEDMAASVRTQ